MSETAAVAIEHPAAQAVAVDSLEFSYGDRRALSDVSFHVDSGEIFGVLGPNGGGKTTLFRILSTLADPHGGTVSVLGMDLIADRSAIRSELGVVFQNASVDPKLTVTENLRYHGLLYGLRASALRSAIDAALERLAIADRAKDLVETLSGGLRRRVELAKGLLCDPRVLVLDEPSTGLDPGARIDLWRYLTRLRDRDGTTILVTTHLMDEAEQCDRLAILDLGRIVATGTPNEMRGRIGGDIITIRSPDPERLAEDIATRFGHRPTRLGDLLRLERPDGHVFVRQVVEAFSKDIAGVSLGKPTLEDVFVHETGHRFWGDT
jgi:ABC-2 type transport system ATP-binding protein